MSGKKKTMGLAVCSMGIGMLLVLIIPGWGFILAAFMVCFGIWEIMC